MYDSIRVRSHICDYKATFVEDIHKSISRHGKKDLFFLVDKNIASKFGLGHKNLAGKNRFFKIETSERNKTNAYCQALIKRLLEKGIRKNSILIAVGGGIVQDIAGFTASILYRGIPWFFYPTTLLAQADSCIGAKTSINVGRYKNLLGTFYPPVEIFIDLNFLKTLPRDAVRSGLGEMLHFYFIAKSDLTAYLSEDYHNIIANPKKFLKKYIYESLQIKKNFVEQDEFDKGKRNILNYGHTFGHAIETSSNYGINHGQAVTMGMDIANYISARLGYLKKRDYDFMHNILIKNMPAFSVKKRNLDSYLRALSMDKKNIDADLTCILTKGPGRMFKHKLPMDGSFKGIIRDYFNTGKFQ